ncbi:MAG: benzoate/H(+) symporter BenE family transporter, partial [Pseudomonadota bacterium]
MASQRPSMQSVSVGLVVAVVGFFSSFPIVLQGLTAMGATNAQAASGLMAAALAMAAAGIGLSLWTRQPISAAWSTPGVALLAIAAVPAGGFHEAVGAFLIAGVLTVIAGFWKPMGRLIAAIPAPLAQAMLAGVLLSLCGQPFVALAERPYLALPIILTWFLVSQISRLFAVPAAVAVAALVVAANVGFDIPRPDSILARPLLFVP